jgi:protein-S-isoprenylcysteine O-methyltransferase Ste14
VRWVVAQFALMALIAVGILAGPRPHALALHVAGASLTGIGVIVVAWARIALGRSFTVLPRPRQGGELVTGGPFRVVRHPVYLGATLLFVGLSLLYSWSSLILSVALALLWAAKARVEERYLVERFPAYEEYRRRVRRRLVPFVY